MEITASEDIFPSSSILLVVNYSILCVTRLSRLDINWVSY